MNAVAKIHASAKNPTAVCKALEPFVNTLLLAKAVAMVEREKCDMIQRRLLATGAYGGDGNPKTVYRLPKASMDQYFADLDAEYRTAGYKDLEPGHCPALTAEYIETQAEWALIKASEPYFGMTNDKLLCGTKEMDGLKTRQKFLDLLVGLVVNRKGYKRPV